MFVHKSIISDEILDYANNNDGFYLAQITRTIDEEPYPDVSKRPMIVSGDITNIEVSSNFLSYSNLYVGINDIAEMFWIDDETYKASYNFWPDPSFNQGYQEGSGPLWVIVGDYNQLVDEESIPENEYIILTFENGSKIKIYFPAVTLISGEAVVFWVAEDGSLFWANTSKVVDIDFYPMQNMDPYYALRHADGLENYNIAKSALDGLRDVTNDEDATSIVVDNGSLDFFSNGVTTTLNVVSG